MIKKAKALKIKKIQNNHCQIGVIKKCEKLRIYDISLAVSVYDISLAKKENKKNVYDISLAKN